MKKVEFFAELYFLIKPLKNYSANLKMNIVGFTEVVKVLQPSII